MTTTPAAPPAVQEPRVSDDKIIDRAILRLAGTPMGMSLEEWGSLSNDLMEVAISSKEKDATIASQAEELAAKDMALAAAREELTLTHTALATAEAALKAAQIENERLDTELDIALMAVLENQAALKAAREALETLLDALPEDGEWGHFLDIKNAARAALAPKEL